MSQKILIKLLLIALIAGALVKVPYGYYQLMRVGVTIGCGYLIFAEGKKYYVPVYLGLIVVFQPVIKLALHKNDWRIIDIVSICLLLILILIDSLLKGKIKGI